MRVADGEHATKTELKHYLDTTDPPALKPTVVKLAAVGKRLAVVNSVFHSPPPPLYHLLGVVG